MIPPEDHLWGVLAPQVAAGRLPFLSGFFSAEVEQSYRTAKYSMVISVLGLG